MVKEIDKFLIDTAGPKLCHRVTCVKSQTTNTRNNICEVAHSIYGPGMKCAGHKPEPNKKGFCSLQHRLKNQGRNYLDLTPNSHYITNIRGNVQQLQGRINNQILGVNPFTPTSDQDRISPYNINTISSSQKYVENFEISTQNIMCLRTR
ncbi:hypothetical protein pdam_00020356 [Pocillopora damicornis]|uniref:Uncharacterized protein n=1 Tax=Pocillopora damicornis TaxID=46731 RepID=A0A3M6UH84_POCDA|nr:hypothetical protein pdam_00020356 [Pocillopora damicornis]